MQGRSSWCVADFWLVWVMSHGLAFVCRGLRWLLRQYASVREMSHGMAVVSRGMAVVSRGPSGHFWLKLCF